MSGYPIAFLLGLALGILGTSIWTDLVGLTRR